MKLINPSSVALLAASALLFPQVGFAQATETATPTQSGQQNQAAVDVVLNDNEVIQGGILRWQIEGAEKCGMNGKSWSAIEGVGYFPIDMDAPIGEKTISITAHGKKKLKTIKIVKKDYGQEVIDLPVEPKTDSPDGENKEHTHDISEFIEPTGKTLAKHHKDHAAVLKIVKGSGGDAKFTLPLAEPTPLPKADPNFAVRRIFNGEMKNRHTGQDYPVGTGTELKAMADGKVVLIGDHFFAGKSIYIDHGNGLVISYLHLDEFITKEGQEVKKGEVVAKSGATGRGTGPHLHIGARWNNARIDPKLLLTAPDQLPSVKD